MLILNENSFYNQKRLNKLLNQKTRGYYTVDMLAIKADIKKYTVLAQKESNKEKKKGYQEIVEYLRALLMQVNPSTKTIKATWFVLHDSVSMHPFPLQNVRWLGLDSTNYICKRDDRTAIVSYTELWNMLALILGHRDLDFNTKAIDEELTKQGCVLHGVAKPSTLYDITIPNAYNELVELRIDNTQYCVYKNQQPTHISYFNQTLETDTYKEMLTKSINYAITVILEDVLDHLPENANLELIGILEDRIYYNTDMTTEDIHKYLSKSVLLRAFGRNFEITPSLELY